MTGAYTQLRQCVDCRKLFQEHTHITECPICGDWVCDDCERFPPHEHAYWCNSYQEEERERQAHLRDKSYWV